MDRHVLFIAPDYSISNLDRRTFDVLQKCGILPEDLGMYSRVGFSNDAAKVHNLFTDKEEVSMVSMSGLLEKKDVLNAMKDILMSEAKVGEASGNLDETSTTNAKIVNKTVILVFCGHGSLDPDGYTLTCSYNQKVTHQDIKSILRSQSFEGQFVQVLNLCCDDIKTPPQSILTSHDCHFDLKWNEVGLMGFTTLDEMRLSLESSPFIQAIADANGNLEECASIWNLNHHAFWWCSEERMISPFV